MSTPDPNQILQAKGLRVVKDGDPERPWCVSGNTFAYREALRSCGGQWSRSAQAWRFADAAALDRLAGALGGDSGLAEGAPAFAHPAPEGGYWGSKHYHGHRDRLRDRFLESGAGALADYELLELLLFFSVRFRDTKPLAKDLIAQFGSLGGVLAGDPGRYVEALVPAAPKEEDKERYAQDLRFTQVLLKGVHDLFQRVLKEEIKAREVISSWTALIDYLHMAMQHEPAEHFRILFLDRKNILIRDEVQSRGTVDHTPLYPREVVKRALELAASAIIMVHNHPSGDPTPSRADIDMTQAVVEALKAVNITVHDHVIVGKNRHLSFRTERLIG